MSIRETPAQLQEDQMGEILSVTMVFYSACDSYIVGILLKNISFWAQNRSLWAEAGFSCRIVLPR